MKLTLLLLALSAAATPLEEDKVFAEGLALFKELEFEQAALRFEQVALDTTRTREERARVVTWLGVCQAKTGAFAPARASFDLAVRLDRDTKLPVSVGPRVVKMFEDALAAAPPPPPPEPEPKPAEPSGPATKPEPADEKLEGEKRELPKPPPYDPSAPENVEPDPVTGVKQAPPRDDFIAEQEGRQTAAFLGAAAGVAGVAALAGGALGAIVMLDANDPEHTQVDAVEQHTVGIVVASLGAVAAVAAAGLGIGALVVGGE